MEFTDEEKEYIIKIKKENNTDKTKKELNNFLANIKEKRI